MAVTKKKYKKRYKFKYKVRWKNVFKFLLCVLLIIVALFTLSHFSLIISQELHTKKMINYGEENATQINIVDDEDTVVVPIDEEISKFDSYWNYIKFSLLQVDLSNLKSLNQDIVGWVQIKNSSINFPVVYGENYKNKSLDGKENSIGWAYTKSNEADIPLNTIITSSKNQNLLGSLKDLLTKDWINDKNNYIIKYYDGHHSSLWQIVSIYHGKYEEVLTEFTDSSYKNYIDEIINKSEINFNSFVNSNDRILTLCTNSNKNDIIVTAKLLKFKNFN